MSERTSPHTGRLFPRIDGGNPSGGYEAVGNVNSTVHLNPFFNIRSLGDNDLYVIDGDLDMTDMEVGLNYSSYVPALGDRHPIMTVTGTITEANLNPFSFDPGCDLNWGFQYSNDTVYAAVVEGLIAVLETPDGTELGCTSSELTLDASGSTSNVDLRFFWFHNGATTPSVTVTQPGTYTVRVQEGFTSCIKTASVEITELPNPPTAVITPSPGTEINETVTEITLDASASTGVGALSYAWSTGATTPEITVRIPGPYSVTVTDSRGCTATEEITIGGEISAFRTISSGDWSNPAIWDIGEVPPNPIPANLTVIVGHQVFINTDIDNQGTINVIENTGQFPNFGRLDIESGSIDNESGANIFVDFGSISLSDDNARLNNLAGGNISFAAGTNMGAFSSQDVNQRYITNAGNISLDGQLNVYGEVFNAAGGQITGTGSINISENSTFLNTGNVNITGGNGALQIFTDGTLDNTNGSFSFAGDFAAGNSTVITGGNFSHVGFLSFFDLTGVANELTFVGDLTLTSIILAVYYGPDAPETANSIQVQGNVDISQSELQFFPEGSPEPPIGHTFNFLEATGTVTGQFTNVPVPIDLGCEKPWQVAYPGNAVSFTIVNPSVATITPSATELDCDVREITLDASGSTGAGPLTYLWSTGETTPVITVETDGAYLVTVTAEDVAECGAVAGVVITRSSTGFITAQIATPDGLTIDCNTPTVLLDATFPSPTATYEWSNGLTVPSFQAEAAGEYEVIINDNGCIDTTSVTVLDGFFTVNGEITAAETEFNCEVTTITLTAQRDNDTRATEYLWEDGSTLATRQVTVAGDYNVTITDVPSGCFAVETIMITEALPVVADLMTPSGTILNCYNPELLLDATTTNPNVSYLWSTGATSATISVTMGDSY
ncbi:MAG: hypothetical protein AAGA62_00320, partial [Bacteroidota bacterium]